MRLRQLFNLRYVNVTVLRRTENPILHPKLVTRRHYETNDRVQYVLVVLECFAFKLSDIVGIKVMTEAFRYFQG